ncbi:g12131 [Coccomyxa viridis]|uniref:arginine decarboxylase n=1 Tax=Coccomyxa viridis TaxID=1274662 RepID=A0ABP1GC87_9CHLO
MPPKGSKAAAKDTAGEGPSKKQKTGDKATKAEIANKCEVISAQDALPATRVKLYNGGQGILLGFRVPKDYFLATGAGDTNEGGGTDPWETGSYDLALEEAQIEDFNVVAYTSVVPPEATEVKVEDVKHTFHHGAVLETIMAKMDGVQGDRISVGVAMMKVRRQSDGHVLGGWAAEYKGHGTDQLVRKILHEDLNGMLKRRFPKGDHEMYDLKYITRVHEVENSYGSVLAAICFCSYIFPIATASVPADKA